MLGPLSPMKMPVSNPLVASSLLNHQYASAIGKSASANVFSTNLMHFGFFFFPIFLQGLCFKTCISGEAPWLKRPFKPCRWKALDQWGVWLHPRSSSGTGGSFKGQDMRLTRIEGMSMSEVSYKVCLSKVYIKGVRWTTGCQQPLKLKLLFTVVNN